VRLLVVWIATLSCAITGAQAASFTPLGFVQNGNNSSVAWGVSADGSSVVGRGNSDVLGYEAFRWTSAGGMVGLGVASSGTSESEALAVSSNGSVTVGFNQINPPPIENPDSRRPILSQPLPARVPVLTVAWPVTPGTWERSPAPGFFFAAGGGAGSISKSRPIGAALAP
jgi:uncharacterized membrane protein